MNSTAISRRDGGLGASSACPTAPAHCGAAASVPAGFDIANDLDHWSTRHLTARALVRRQPRKWLGNWRMMPELRTSAMSRMCRWISSYASMLAW